MAPPRPLPSSHSILPCPKSCVPHLVPGPPFVLNATLLQGNTLSPQQISVRCSALFCEKLSAANYYYFLTCSRCLSAPPSA